MISNTSAILKDVDIDETTPSDQYFISCWLESIVTCNKRKLKIFRPYPKVSRETLANYLTLTLNLNDHIIDPEMKSNF